MKKIRDYSNLLVDVGGGKMPAKEADTTTAAFLICNAEDAGCSQTRKSTSMF